MNLGLRETNTHLFRAIRDILAIPAADIGEMVLPILERFSTEDWASLTFAGTRHCLEFRLEGNEAAVLSAYEAVNLYLNNLELSIARHFLADTQLEQIDIIATGDGRVSMRLKLEALTIEE